MLLSSHSNKDNAKRATVAALTLLMAAAGAGQVAGAQGLSDPAMSQGSPMGADQESLLPPEVVPLDPASANSLSASQAMNRQTQLEPGGVPGLVSQGKGTISARDFRSAAFDSLYTNQGQSNLQQQQQQLQQQWQNGGVSFTPQQNPISAMYPQDTMSMNAQAPQSQTLSGGSKKKPVRHDIRRGGFSNNMSGLASFGAGALSATYLMRPSNALMGLGMWGLTTSGFGTRNGFHF